MTPIYTVLIVDDEPLVLEGLKLLVHWQEHGFRIGGEAGDGEEALDRIRELDPDLVVTDIRMPAVDGLELIERCSGDGKARCKFVILSGHEDFSLAHKALQYGVKNYWLKPIDTDEIHQTLTVLRKELDAESAERQPAPDDSLSAESGSGNAGRQSAPTLSQALYDAEDALLQAIDENDRSGIDLASERLSEQLSRSFPEAALLRSYLSHFVMDLVRKTAELEPGRPSGEAGYTVPAELQQPVAEAWKDSLAAFCRQTAARLAERRAKAGPVGDALRYVRSHFDKPLKLQTVAGELHFQPAYLGQLFKKTVGMSFLDYVHFVRIEEARKLLRRTDLKIADVARRVGYADPEQFAAKFKQHANVLPSQYKKG